MLKEDLNLSDEELIQLKIDLENSMLATSKESYLIELSNKEKLNRLNILKKDLSTKENKLNKYNQLYKNIKDYSLREKISKSLKKFNAEYQEMSRELSMLEYDLEEPLLQIKDLLNKTISIRQSLDL